MQAIRHWAVRHARAVHRVYEVFSRFVPALAPLVRWLGRRRAEALLYPVERSAKRLVFDCRECGQCVLSVTGMACPMNCPKRMRNGPCGGVRADGHCEVDPGMPCVWVKAGEGDVRIGAGRHTERWRSRLPVLEANRQGSSTWIGLITPPPARADPAATPTTGTTAAAAPAPSVASDFEAACRSGEFVVTAEISPPDSHDPEALLQRAAHLQGLVHALNITDGAGGNCHMSSVAAASVLSAHGHEAVCQVGCRDRNRIALQGDVLGAAALGVRNVLCLTGDDVSQGDHPGARPVFDLDAVNLLATIDGMRVRGEYASGRKLAAPVPLFLGATCNPFVPPFTDRIANLERKIGAGARFIQTQFCFDPGLFARFMDEVRRRGLHRCAAFLVGVGTLPSARRLRWMADHVPGVHVPEAVTRRIAAAADEKTEGIRVCVEAIHALRRIEGVAGVHLMGHRNEATLAQIIVDAGLVVSARHRKGTACSNPQKLHTNRPTASA